MDFCRKEYSVVSSQQSAQRLAVGIFTDGIVVKTTGYISSIVSWIMRNETGGSL